MRKDRERVTTAENAFLRIRKIEEGTVVDHISDGRSPLVLKLLGITGGEDNPVSVAMHVDSKKLGKKDMIKAEYMFLDSRLIDNIALISPTATINIVENYEIKEKRAVQVPQHVVGIMRCPNPTCITNNTREEVDSNFELLRRRPLLYICRYCDRVVEESDIPKCLTS